MCRRFTAILFLFFSALLFPALLCPLLCAGIFSAAAVYADTSETKELTVMLYLCGSDLESGNGSASEDLHEIMRSRYNYDRVNVVVAAGGTKEWHNSFSSGETGIYCYGSNLQWNKSCNLFADESGIPANMGDPSTLEAFLDYSREQFPAENYALILWNHGGGPLRGVCWDTQWAMDNLSMQELCSALAASPFAEEKLSWIGFDACLMSSIETAFLMEPYAEYMIASEETEPAAGWAYSFLRDIEMDTDGAQTGRRIVDSYFAESGPSGAALTLACTDLSQTVQAEEKINAFFNRLNESLDPSSFSELSNMRHDAREFGRADEPEQHLDLVDLGDLVRHYASEAPKEAAELQNALKNMTVYSRSNLKDCNGISIYHPYYNKLFYEKRWRDEYTAFPFLLSYQAYIRNFADIWLDESLGEWGSLGQAAAEEMTDTEPQITFQLTEDQIAHFASAQLLILSSVGSEADTSGQSFAQVCVSDDVTLTENGVLISPYSGKTLYAVGDDGEIIAGPIDYSLTDDGILLVLVNYIDSEGRRDKQVTHTVFECLPVDVGNDLPILDQYIYNEDIGMYQNRLRINEEDYTGIIFLHDYRNKTYDGEVLLPFREWEDSDWIGGFERTLPLAFHFRFFDSLLTNESLYACFQINDTQAVTHCTELMPLTDKEDGQIKFEENTWEDDQISLSISGELTETPLDRYLTLQADIRSLADKELRLKCRNGNLILNGTRACPENDFSKVTNLDPGETGTMSWRISEESLIGLDTIEDVEIILSFDEKDEKELHFRPVNLHVQSLSGKYDLQKEISSVKKRGVQYGLLELAEDSNGDVKGILHCENNSGEQIDYEERELYLDINGIQLDCRGIYELNLPDGTDCLVSFYGKNRQSYDSFFKHKNGSEHLIASNVLGNAGLQEITEIMLEDTHIGAALFSNGIRFSLEEPLSYTAVTEGEAAERTELYADEDLTIYGESILLADRTIIMSLVVANRGSDNCTLSFDKWFFNNYGESYSYPDSITILAGSEYRFYLYRKCMDENTDPSLSSVSLQVCRETAGTPDVYRLTLRFAPELPFEEEGGISLGFADANPNFEIIYGNNPDS